MTSWVCVVPSGVPQRRRAAAEAMWVEEGGGAVIARATRGTRRSGGAPRRPTGALVAGKPTRLLVYVVYQYMQQQLQSNDFCKGVVWASVCDVCVCVCAEPVRSLYLAVDGRRLDAGNTWVPVRDKTVLEVRCVAEGGVPAPALSWRLLALEPALDHRPYLRTQPANHSREGVTWSLASVTAARELHNASLQCEARQRRPPATPDTPATHVTPGTPAEDTEPTPPDVHTTKLEIHVTYPPSFVISRWPGFGVALRAGGAAALRCDVDANPPARAWWRRDDAPPDSAPPLGGAERGSSASLRWGTLSAAHGGWYRCRASWLDQEYSSIGYYLNVLSADETSSASSGASDTEAEEEDEEGEEVDHQKVDVPLGGSVQLHCPKAVLDDIYFIDRQKWITLSTCPHIIDFEHHGHYTRHTLLYTTIATSARGVLVAARARQRVGRRGRRRRGAGAGAGGVGGGGGWAPAGSHHAHGVLGIKEALYQEGGEYRCVGARGADMARLRELKRVTLRVTGEIRVCTTDRLCSDSVIHAQAARRRASCQPHCGGGRLAAGVRPCGRALRVLWLLRGRALPAALAPDHSPHCWRAVLLLAEPDEVSAPHSPHCWRAVLLLAEPDEVSAPHSPHCWRAVLLLAEPDEVSAPHSPHCWRAVLLLAEPDEVSAPHSPHCWRAVLLLAEPDEVSAPHSPHCWRAVLLLAEPDEVSAPTARTAGAPCCCWPSPTRSVPPQPALLARRAAAGRARRGQCPHSPHCWRAVLLLAEPDEVSAPHSPHCWRAVLLLAEPDEVSAPHSPHSWPSPTRSVPPTARTAAGRARRGQCPPQPALLARRAAAGRARRGQCPPQPALLAEPGEVSAPHSPHSWPSPARFPLHLFERCFPTNQSVQQFANQLLNGFFKVWCVAGGAGGGAVAVFPPRAPAPARHTVRALHGGAALPLPGGLATLALATLATLASLAGRAD
ncbi:hypothetical protein MSG28_015835 [Choristoneura fumiferana]|uniref:Uncharacterized protein n=1 Tax=Choristoneura fumiferana TaxID=7141 RepID=A0ACC0KBT3_CHOFU|nr:hypothetical protein MSG28_015835 [Choristoneura fumiferana]